MKTIKIIGVWFAVIMATSHHATAHSGSKAVKTSIAPKSTTETTLLSCPAPTNITLSDVTTTSATLEWTPEIEGTWSVIKYGELDFDFENEGITINVGVGGYHYVLNNLEPNTNYEVYLRSVCEITNYGSWTEPVLFETTEVLCPQGDIYFNSQAEIDSF